nr:UDP-N-acetylglucosamine 2-epimerase (hydrolyzing) [Lachnospiraceae bacterium]
GVRIDEEVRIPTRSVEKTDIAHNQAETLIKFTDLFAKKAYDAIVILGDRYEMLMVAIAAFNLQIPICHLCGGDTTEGAIDEGIRHSITKMSYYHFPTNVVSRDRILQLGEMPERVFNYGSTSVDNIVKMDLMERKEALESVGLDEVNYAIGTYHPVTLEEGSVEEEMNHFLDAIRKHPEITFIITKSNADLGGAFINEILEKSEKQIPNLHVFASLGVKRYLSLTKYALFMIGNSSSGIIEAPALRIPTINIGERQKGRLRADSVIDCGEDTASIMKAIDKALAPEMSEICRKQSCPYGDGNAAPNIAKKIIEMLEYPIDLKKKFYDLKR